MSAASLVRVTDLHRYYADTHALDGVTFEVRRGEVVGLLGPNGAGKSTTMQILCGVLAPSAGTVEIAGADLAAEPARAKRHLGYLPEHPPLYRDLTVHEYLTFCARLRSVADVPGAVAEAMTRCGLNDVAGRLLGNLSNGYQQRAGIAQAVVHRPDVVVLDEPTAGLDPIQIREIRALVTELGRDFSVVLSTHILPEAQAVCDRVLILYAGRIVLDAPLAEVTDSRSRVFRLGLRVDPGIDTLARLPGVLAVSATGAGYWRVTLPGDADPATVLAAPAAHGEWGLFELTPETNALEDVFISLTRGAAVPGPDEPGPGPATPDSGPPAAIDRGPAGNATAGTRV